MPVLVAAFLWFVMLLSLTAPHRNFWDVMAGAAALLWGMSAWLGHDFRKQFACTWQSVAVGLLSAALLWGVFYMGDAIAAWLFDFAKPQFHDIYRIKEGETPLFVALLLALLIGPAEEIFWRGYVQRSFIAKYGEWPAFFLTTLIYALVHVWSFNFMLLMAAAVCGAFWGLLYRYHKNLMTLIISHAVWDVAVFILFPI